MPPIEIGPLPPDAAGELLTLQRAAYVTEAQLYDDVRLPALVQTLDELVGELATSTCLAAIAGSRSAAWRNVPERERGTQLDGLLERLSRGL